MDMNPVLKLVPIALPKAGKRHDTQLPVLKTVRDSEGHGRDFFVFDMEINQRAFAVSFIAGILLSLGSWHLTEREITNRLSW